MFLTLLHYTHCYCITAGKTTLLNLIAGRISPKCLAAGDSPVQRKVSGGGSSMVVVVAVVELVVAMCIVVVAAVQ